MTREMAMPVREADPLHVEPEISSVQITRRRFSVDDYYHMLEAGILTEADRVELIDGEVCEMSPIDPIHAANVMRLDRQLQKLVGDQAIVNVQNPIRLNDHNEPQPELTVLRWNDDFYAQQHPTPADVLIAIEVANTSLVYDRKEKLPRYAEANIPEVWLVNIGRKTVEQYTKPLNGQYTAMQVVVPGQSITAQTINELQIPVDQIFGRQSS